MFNIFNKITGKIGLCFAIIFSLFALTAMTSCSNIDMSQQIMINCKEVSTGNLYQVRTYGHRPVTPEMAIINGTGQMHYFLNGESFAAVRNSYRLTTWEVGEEGKIKTFVLFNRKQGDREFVNLPIGKRVFMTENEIQKHNNER